MRKFIEVDCDECGKSVKKKPYQIKDHKNHFCNGSCAASFRNRERGLKYIDNVECDWCGSKLSRSPWYLKTNKNHFCDKSCRMSYMNSNKTKAYKRSKLEMWLESQLCERYPNLKFSFNDSTHIGQELDIYIPSHKLAFELNGIFHYEPIFGEDYLDSVKNRDSNKFKLCRDNDISLCIIDSSGQKNFTEKDSEKYLRIITDIIDDRV